MYIYNMYTHNGLKILSPSIPEPVGTFRLTSQKLLNRPQSLRFQAQLRSRLKSGSQPPPADGPVGTKAAKAAGASNFIVI